MVKWCWKLCMNLVKIFVGSWNETKLESVKFARYVSKRFYFPLRDKDLLQLPHIYKIYNIFTAQILLKMLFSSTAKHLFYLFKSIEGLSILWQWCIERCHSFLKIKWNPTSLVSKGIILNVTRIHYKMKISNWQSKFFLIFSMCILDVL